jgi:DNA polymerase-4
MTLDQGRFFCPSLRIISPDKRIVELAHNSLQDLVRRFTPVWEPVGPGRFYLDLTGTARLFGRAVDTAARINREVVERSGLSGVAGLAINKLVSGIAAGSIVKPPDLHGVNPGGEEKFLAPRPVASLPSLNRLSTGRTPEFLALVGDLHLDTLGAIAGTSLDYLELVFGPPARLMQQWAVGFDPTPVWPQSTRPSLEVSHILNPDEIDDGALLALLYGLLEKLCRRLRRGERLCRSVRLDLLQSDTRETTGRVMLARASHWECDIYPHLEKLFFRSFTRRVRVRTMTLRAEALEQAERQWALFPQAASEEKVRMQRLASALDRLRARYGENAVVWGAA